MITNNFTKRHIGIKASELDTMLKKIGAESVEQLVNETIPDNVRLKQDLDLPEGISEQEYINHIKALGAKNKQFRSFTGMGYYPTVLPPVILRNVLENTGWYTAYTPYQAEISQGRLQALLNFQTMVSDLTAMPMANCSLLDEATAAAEAMLMAFNSRSRKQVKAGANKIFVDAETFPQNLALIKTRAWPKKIEVVVGNFADFEMTDDFFGAIVQYPNNKGAVCDYRALTEAVQAQEGMLIAIVDLLSLTMLTPPGEWGADVVVGSAQRFGVPMGFGGPHAGFLAAREKHKRNMPGRIIGITKDSQGKQALRMALQTREQHIKRERATSNICTAQALLATMAGFYAAYHGPDGLLQIAQDIHQNAIALSDGLEALGYTQENKVYFDTLYVTGIDNIANICQAALDKEINLRYFENAIGISINELTTLDDLNDLLEIFANASQKESIAMDSEVPESIITEPFLRTSDYLTHKVFNTYHSETEMMRYMKMLEIQDLSLNRAMIPLGSCTMKLNSAASMLSLSWPEFGNIHPFVPKDQVQGYLEMINDLNQLLSKITGFAAMSFQPNSGANGEYSGMLCIRAYHEDRGEGHRNICLIPSSAHGTNPASAVAAGYDLVIVKATENGEVDVEDLRTKVEAHKDNLAALMITFPSTHGAYEAGVPEIVDIIHKNGGQVYMDGANMNAQVGLTNPGFIGADVCHLNLHKTFAIPHGGGGPGVGSIGVAKHLVPYLPGNPAFEVGGKKSLGSVAGAPYGSALILPITYGYIKMLGKEGLKQATEMAILNANYLKACLEEHYPILYTNEKGRVAHEMIVDCNKFSHTADIQVGDIAKRLMDYGFHAPTVAFPVHGTLMVEPTESEPLYELNRFVDAMISIREEIKSIEEGKAAKDNNVVKNAPHTAAMVTADQWDKPYGRQQAAYPKKWSFTDKYWPAVAKVDDAFGDRNLFCTCGSANEYVKE